MFRTAARRPWGATNRAGFQDHAEATITLGAGSTAGATVWTIAAASKASITRCLARVALTVRLIYGRSNFVSPPGKTRATAFRTWLVSPGSPVWWSHPIRKASMNRA